MKAEDESRLESIMDAFEQKLARSKDDKVRRQSEQEAFFVEFDRVKTEVIRPVLDDIVTHLKARGHTCEIFDVGDERSKTNAKVTLRITIRGMPTSAYTAENTVSISFLRGSQTTISFVAEIPDRKRKEFPDLRGTYTLSELSADIVQQKVLEVLEEVFAPK